MAFLSADLFICRSICEGRRLMTYLSAVAICEGRRLMTYLSAVAVLRRHDDYYTCLGIIIPFGGIIIPFRVCLYPFIHNKETHNKSPQGITPKSKK